MKFTTEGKYMYKFKQKIEDYTEEEFIEFLNEFMNPSGKRGKEWDKYSDALMDHFIEITGHPKKGDLIAYPEKPGDDEPENVIKIIKAWRKSQSLSLFKDSESK